VARKRRGQGSPRRAADIARQVAAEAGLPIKRLSPRVTVAHTSHLSAAKRESDAERDRYPDANVTISGRPGKWRVRRDRQGFDQEKVPVRVHHRP
jgi:hypothetical protein